MMQLSQNTKFLISTSTKLPNVRVLISLQNQELYYSDTNNLQETHKNITYRAGFWEQNIFWFPLPPKFSPGQSPCFDKVTVTPDSHSTAVWFGVQF